MGQVTITLANRGGASFRVDQRTPLLDALETQGMSLPYGCRYGGCISCAAKLLSGKIDQRAAVALNGFMSSTATLGCPGRVSEPARPAKRRVFGRMGWRQRRGLRASRYCSRAMAMAAPSVRPAPMSAGPRITSSSSRRWASHSARSSARLGSAHQAPIAPQRRLGSDDRREATRAAVPSSTPLQTPARRSPLPRRGIVRQTGGACWPCGNGPTR